MPETYAVAYYIKNGDMFVASAYIPFRETLPNFVKFSFDKKNVEPGTEIQFKVESYLESIISLSAIDQR
jgi:Alpha-2-macroglobulin bait region domain